MTTFEFIKVKFFPETRSDKFHVYQSQAQITQKHPSLHTPYRCTQECHRKPKLLRGEQSKPEKCPPLSRAKQEMFPSLNTPYRCTQKCHRKPPLLRGEQSKPWKVPPSLSSKVRDVSLSKYPLPVHPKVPHKTTTFFRGKQSKPLSDALSVKNIKTISPCIFLAKGLRDCPNNQISQKLINSHINTSNLEFTLYC